jgi:hypothetical protein
MDLCFPSHIFELHSSELEGAKLLYQGRLVEAQ